jgi:hypothetical protein
MAGLSQEVSVPCKKSAKERVALTEKLMVLAKSFSEEFIA